MIAPLSRFYFNSVYIFYFLSNQLPSVFHNNCISLRKVLIHIYFYRVDIDIFNIYIYHVTSNQTVQYSHLE